MCCTSQRDENNICRNTDTDNEFLFDDNANQIRDNLIFNELSRDIIRNIKGFHTGNSHIPGIFNDFTDRIYVSKISYITNPNEGFAIYDQLRNNNFYDTNRIEECIQSIQAAIVFYGPLGVEFWYRRIPGLNIPSSEKNGTIVGWTTIDNTLFWRVVIPDFQNYINVRSSRNNIDPSTWSGIDIPFYFIRNYRGPYILCTRVERVLQLNS